MIATASSKPSVLVVDDEQGILDSLRILLKTEGFEPHLAHGGRAGIAKLAELSPDIILTDVRMPDATGVEVLSAARRSIASSASRISRSSRRSCAATAARARAPSATRGHGPTCCGSRRR
ncbi:MAG: response regulator, partial [Gemmatimonadaceae bacterium]|nr:response regulator [Gemmatimonadaceae bacterium]